MTVSCERFLVCGCGPSMADAALWLYGAHGFTTVGVNDVAQWWEPDHLLVVDMARQFSAERLATIRQCLPQKVWHLHPDPPPCVSDGTFGWVSEVPREQVTVRQMPAAGQPLDLDAVGLYVYQTSVLPAVHLAYKLGARDIGLVGADFGPECNLHAVVKQISGQFERLRGALELCGVRLVNLSHRSLLEGVPKMPLWTWLEEAVSTRVS